MDDNYISSKDVAKVVEMLMDTGIHRAVKYVSPTMVISGTRKLTLGKIDRRDRSIDIILKIGRPNYWQRDFIKKCKNAGEPFPVKKIQLKMPPKRKV